jgi:transcriptional regulator with XRE-family HTH domain
LVRDREVALLVKRTLEAVAPELKQIAEERGLNYSTMLSWRSGSRTPSSDNLSRIAELADQRADLLRGLAVELRDAVEGEPERRRVDLPKEEEKEGDPEGQGDDG